VRVLVTGAANGIGAAIASRFAADAQRLGQTARLVLVDLDEGGLARLAGQLRDAECEVLTVAGDLSLAETPAQAVAAAQRAFGGLDVVVSNAGISIKMNLQDYSVEQFDKVLAVNLRATWLLGKAAHPLLSASKGCIIATASISGAHPTPKSGPYSTTKAALTDARLSYCECRVPAGGLTLAVRPSGFSVVSDLPASTTMSAPLIAFWPRQARV